MDAILGERRGEPDVAASFSLLMSVKVQPPPMPFAVRQSMTRVGLPASIWSMKPGLLLQPISK